jgi:hypothetical protein
MTMFKSCVILLSLLLVFEGAGAVELSIPDTTVVEGDTFLIPVRTGDVTGLGVVAYELTVGFQAGILEPIDATSENTISAGWGSPVVNTGFVDRISVTSAGITPLVGEGDLVRLELHVMGSSGSVTSLEFLHAMYNEGNPPVEYDVPACSVWIAENSATYQRGYMPDALDFQIFPNPTNSGLTLSVTGLLPVGGRLEFYNILGRLIHGIDIGAWGGAKHRITIDVASLPSGYYLAMFTTRSQSIAKPLVVLK